MAREQFTFYRSYWEAVKRLRKPADRLSALEAIAAYALDGEERDLTDAADAIFVLIRPVLDSAAKKSKGGKASPSNEEDADKISASIEEDTDNKKENKKKNKKEGEKENECYIAPARFVRPSLEEVTEYCLERGGVVDPQRWYAYYESNGWKVGKNPMKDWKAAVRTWERNRQPNNSSSKPQEKRELSEDELLEFRKRRAAEIAAWNEKNKGR